MQARQIHMQHPEPLVRCPAAWLTGWLAKVTRIKLLSRLSPVNFFKSFNEFIFVLFPPPKLGLIYLRILQTLLYKVGYMAKRKKKITWKILAKVSL